MTDKTTGGQADESSIALERECRHCGTAIEDDDLTFRVVYGYLSEVREDNISEKQVGHVGEELDPGADERYWCFSCFKREREADRAAHYHYEDAAELWDILEAADGSLVADARPLTVGGRGWFRVVDGSVQARHSVHVHGGEDDDWDIGFDTEPTEGFDTADFGDFFESAEEDRRLVLLKPVDETPFIAGQNRTLGVDYGE